MTAELLDLAKQYTPFLVPFLVSGVILKYGLEKVTGSNGLVTRFVHWVQNRELQQLRRQAELEQERRRLAAITESPLLQDLRRQVEDLQRRLGRTEDELEGVRDDLRISEREAVDLRRRDQHRSRWEHDMALWVARNMPVLERVGPITPPPRHIPLPDLVVDREDARRMVTGEQRAVH
jgi:hypothetical protein